MDKGEHVSVEFVLEWPSAHATHTERYFLDKVNLWRDVLPGSLGEAMGELTEGESARQAFGAGDLVAAHDGAQIRTIGLSHLHATCRSARCLPLREDRFYPRALFAEPLNTFPQDRRALRCIDLEAEAVRLDLNHPLAGYPLAIQATVLERRQAGEEHGGRCHDVGEIMTDGGPGLQAPVPGKFTDFYSGAPFDRSDNVGDAVFYQAPRFVDHLDTTALEQVTALYSRFLISEMKVLDLMSSWNSHLPETLDLDVVGLGMNGEEMEKNPRLSEFLVHDLNADPHLPFDDEDFDAVLCTVSVEYLTQPLAVFAEVARVLRPGAPFVVTFSDRWFPPKVIRLWQELHPFERVGLVLDYFARTGRFRDLGTESVRGLPRPGDDKYVRQTPYSDPIYAVWGRASGPVT